MIPVQSSELLLKYGDEALKIATTVKLTRALWIVPIALVTAFVLKKNETKKISQDNVSVFYFGFYRGFFGCDFFA